MARYQFLTKDLMYQAFNKVRDSFLASKNVEEVDAVIDAVLTKDEKLKIGRRVLIATFLENGLIFDEIRRQLKVGLTTINSVARKLDNDRKGFSVIFERGLKVENEYRRKAYRKVGAKRVFKWKEYTGFKRSDVPR